MERGTCPMTEQTVGWALHALEPEEEMASIAHLETCAECRQTAAQVADVTTGLGSAVEQREPPAGLRASILDEAARTPQIRPEPRHRAEPARVDAEESESGPRHRADRSDTSRPSGTRRPGGRPGRGRVAAACWSRRPPRSRSCGGGGLVIYAQQMRSERDASMAQAQNIFDAVARFDRPGTTHAFLAPPTPNAQPVAAVMVDGDQRMVISMGLPENSVEDQTYVLWGMHDTGAPQPVGTFDVNPTPGSPISVASSPGGTFAKYAISLERGRQAPASPSSVMAMGPVET